MDATYNICIIGESSGWLQRALKPLVCFQCGKLGHIDIWCTSGGDSCDSLLVHGQVRCNGVGHWARYNIKGAAQSEHTPKGKTEKADLVSKIKARLASVDPNKARELGGVFLFNIIKGTSVYSWTLDLNQVTVYEGEPPHDPDTTFTLNEHYFKQLVTGREDPRVIMQAGRCSVTGDIMRAMQLEPYIKLE